ncbi:MAG: SDR family NAD(P)-dependent oxidoreductase [Chryseobacterium sp.]|uniref:SDR family NAD(P)-dependent oxidoreductase n=1 Tax=Chryseobacterium sp. TaxID=1871047 RepID=UPI0025C370AD|nr:SDR family NAD(P)-dependent oxidoreductase [Chryseobacterium sp.]MCJ7932231.1 SDR family NAD(P)-dependent oxidoreductase [Chryseobacterium sp.]
MKQKVWLITGVSKGLGREIAKQVACTGDIVIGTVRNEKDKVAFENSIDAKALIIDLAETEQIPTLITSIVKEHGRIDVLVNNAGFGAFGMIEEFDKEEIINQFNVNFIAVWKLCQAVLPYMRDNGHGTIVQISSRTGIMAGIGNGIYASSKFALEGMSEALKQEVEPFGIKVMLAELGALRTDFFGASIRYAKNNLSPYAEKLDDIRTNTKKLNGKQSGNPIKVAQVIIEAVNNDVPTFRLPLTAGTIDTMKAKIAEFQNCIALTENIARSIDY